jgi:prevent-host-death family protein
MLTVNVQQAKMQIEQLLEVVITGEEVLITQQELPIARILPMSTTRKFEDLSAFRASLTPAKTQSPDLIRRMRDED